MGLKSARRGCEMFKKQNMASLAVKPSPAGIIAELILFLKHFTFPIITLKAILSIEILKHFTLRIAE
jgi:hypothetical protein